MQISQIDHDGVGGALQVRLPYYSVHKNRQHLSAVVIVQLWVLLLLAL